MYKNRILYNAVGLKNTRKMVLAGRFPAKARRWLMD